VNPNFAQKLHISNNLNAKINPAYDISNKPKSEFDQLGAKCSQQTNISLTNSLIAIFF